jgi:hypothetical protein
MPRYAPLAPYGHKEGALRAAPKTAQRARAMGPRRLAAASVAGKFVANGSSLRPPPRAVRREKRLASASCRVGHAADDPRYDPDWRRPSSSNDLGGSEICGMVGRRITFCRVSPLPLTKTRRRDLHRRACADDPQAKTPPMKFRPFDFRRPALRLAPGSRAANPRATGRLPSILTPQLSEPIL